MMFLSMIAILGGGITGLAAAMRLIERAPNRAWTLFEASPRLGGVLKTVERDGWLIEQSADNFLTRDPWATDLCTRVGLAEELLETDPNRRRALVVHKGHVTPVPEGFVLMSARRLGPTLASPLLSPLGKLRLLAEPLVPRRRDPGDESVASFVRRRLGGEVFERLVQPLVGGIYTADPDRLSVEATFPQFVRQEAEHGSLWRAARRSPKPKEDAESGARYGMFVAPRRGVGQLVDKIASHLPADRLRTSVRVSGIKRTESGGWRLAGEAGEPLGDFESVLCALPAYHAAKLVRDFDRDFATELDAIEYAGASVVCLGVRDEQITRPIHGFGFVVPASEGRQILAASFASYKFPGRAPQGHTLVRVFVGGALQPELADLEDKELSRLACDELASLVGLRGDPLFADVARWSRRMPQYHVGHLERVARIESAAQRWRGLELAGAAYRGVGVPQCIRSGELAADRVLNIE